MDKKLYDYFLSGYKYDEKNNEEFNYKFSNNYSVDKFYAEFNKFISLSDSFFYDNTKMLTAFNSYDIIIPKKIIRHIIKLYNYSTNNKCEIQRNIIGDFLLTYYNTIGLNKKNDKKYKNVEKQYKKIMIEFLNRNFYSQLMTDESQFYLEVTKYGLSNEKYIAPQVVYRMLNNIKNDSIRNLLIDELIKDDKFLFIVIDYDCELSKHKLYYLDFIKEILNQKYGYNDINKLFKRIVFNNCLSDKEIKEIINLYIKKTNDLCERYKDKTTEFIGSLSEIEHLRKNLVEVINIDILDPKYKEKLHECLINILSLKRFLLEDESYVTSSMQDFSTTATFSNKQTTKFVEELSNNVFKIYSASSLDFDKCMEDALNHYSKFTFQSIVSYFSVDCSSQTYSTNDIFMTNYKYSFEKYYEAKGKQFTIDNQNKLSNIMLKGYYIEMLKDLSRTFYVHQNIIISILGKDNYSSLIENLKREFWNTEINNYAVIVKNILAIELNIKKKLTKSSIKYSSDMTRNLDLLFEKYIDNKATRDGIMYLYYALYEKSGPNLRNKAMHGSLINEDLRIPLLLSFSGLIFSSWLINEKK